jgi:hypothetical protein
MLLEVNEDCHLATFGVGNELDSSHRLFCHACELDIYRFR